MTFESHCSKIPRRPNSFEKILISFVSPMGMVSVRLLDAALPVFRYKDS